VTEISEHLSLQDLPEMHEGSDQFAVALDLRRRVKEAVERGRKVWQPGSRRAMETFITLERHELVRVLHSCIALSVLVQPRPGHADLRSYQTEPESLWHLFEAAWVKARVDHDEFGAGLLWRVEPEVTCRCYPGYAELWQMYLRFGFVPARAVKMLTDDDETAIREAPIRRELEGLA
jgi:hypothetical protein